MKNIPTLLRRLLVPVLILAAVTTVNAQERQAPNKETHDAQWYFNKGNEYFSRKNYSRAKSCFIRADEMFGGRNTACQNNIGNCYRYEQDFIQAVLWYRKAADKGDAMAQYNLAGCYARGEGVTKNESTAEYWYRKSAANGYEKAQVMMNLMEYIK